MEKLSKEEQEIVTQLIEKYGDVFFALIGANYIKGMDLKTSVWDCYNKLNTK